MTEVGYSSGFIAAIVILFIIDLILLAVDLFLKFSPNTFSKGTTKTSTKASK